MHRKGIWQNASLCNAGKLIAQTSPHVPAHSGGSALYCAHTPVSNYKRVVLRKLRLTRPPNSRDLERLKLPISFCASCPDSDEPILQRYLGIQQINKRLDSINSHFKCI